MSVVIPVFSLVNSDLTHRDILPKVNTITRLRGWGEGGSMPVQYALGVKDFR